MLSRVPRPVPGYLGLPFSFPALFQLFFLEAGQTLASTKREKGKAREESSRKTCGSITKQAQDAEPECREYSRRKDSLDVRDEDLGKRSATVVVVCV